MTKDAEQMRVRRRRHAVEDLYLNGVKAQEIHDRLGQTFGVTYGTIRNDIVAVRKAWRDQLKEMSTLEGPEEYVARLTQMRRAAYTGWEEDGKDGRKRIVGRDFRLVHQIDKELAKLQGVDIKDGASVTVNIQSVRAFMDKIMKRIFTVVTDPTMQDEIVAILKDAATASSDE